MYGNSFFVTMHDFCQIFLPFIEDLKSLRTQTFWLKPATVKLNSEMLL